MLGISRGSTELHSHGQIVLPAVLDVFADADDKALRIVCSHKHPLSKLVEWNYHVVSLPHALSRTHWWDGEGEFAPASFDDDIGDGCSRRPHALPRLVLVGIGVDGAIFYADVVPLPQPSVVGSQIVEAVAYS